MDAKQACDKLNGFNFQNRYLVGMSDNMLWTNEILGFRVNGCSSLPSTRKDGKIKRRFGGTTRELGEAEKAARHRLNLGYGMSLDFIWIDTLRARVGGPTHRFLPRLWYCTAWSTAF